MALDLLSVGISRVLKAGKVAGAEEQLADGLETGISCVRKQALLFNIALLYYCAPYATQIDRTIHSNGMRFNGYSFFDLLHGI